MITFSEAAAAKVREMIVAEGDPGLALRISVSGGGCAGYQYGMAFARNATESDTVLEQAGFRVLVDAESARFLQGVVVDYVDSLMGSGFKIENPNARSTCGCGNSFAVDEEEGEPNPELAQKVAEVLETIRPYLRADGGDVELVGVAGQTVKVRLAGACSGCSSSTVTLQLVIEKKIKEVFPEVARVVAV